MRSVPSGETASAVSPLKLTDLERFRTFITEQKKYEDSCDYEHMRCVGKVIRATYNKVIVTTNDAVMLTLNGIPKGSYLLMVSGSRPDSFILLRVNDYVPTPVESQMQQLSFELQKRPVLDEIDIWTKADLEWTAVECEVAGTFSLEKDCNGKMQFGRDVRCMLSPHSYTAYSPDKNILDLILNRSCGHIEEIGMYRATESEYDPSESIPIFINLDDIFGNRVAVFAKTRMGKTFFIKNIIIAGIRRRIGQLVIDVQGEISRRTTGGKSVAELFPESTRVYSLSRSTGDELLRVNFYTDPSLAMNMMRMMINTGSKYITGFFSTEMPDIKAVKSMSPGRDKTRSIRLLQLFWSILYLAGFEVDEKQLLGLGLKQRNVSGLNPGFSAKLRKAIYDETAMPPAPSSLSSLAAEWTALAEYIRKCPKDEILISSDEKDSLDADILAGLRFLCPITGTGPAILRPLLPYHGATKSDVISEIIIQLEQGVTVILNLANAREDIAKYYSDFVISRLYDHLTSLNIKGKLSREARMQLYIEEAHTLMPRDERDLDSNPYFRMNKLAGKLGVGMVYATQSPSTLSQKLLIETENLLVGHLAGINDAKTISAVKAEFSGYEDSINRIQTPGYFFVRTSSSRLVVPTQLHPFEGGM